MIITAFDKCNSDIQLIRMNKLVIRLPSIAFIIKIIVKGEIGNRITKFKQEKNIGRPLIQNFNQRYCKIA